MQPRRCTRDRLEQKIEGLDLGADDVVTKRFELNELMGLLARSQGRTFSRDLILNRIWG